MKRIWLIVLPVLALIAIGAYFWLHRAPPPPPAPVPVVTPPPITPAPPPAPPKPAVEFPVAAPPGIGELPPLELADKFVKGKLTELLGAKTVLSQLQLENFVRRVVATVDNLARAFAPPKVWPINPAPGRFAIETKSDGTYISAKNEARYTPFVNMVDAVDAERAVALYRELYPLFQRAYESLGYPGKYFNDRLIAVIDVLLKTPEPAAPLKVELPEIRGPLQPAHPWLLYRYADPEIEALPIGQRILLRMGIRNETRLKAKLAEIRKLIVANKPGR